MLKLFRYATISLGILGLLFMIFTIFVGISMKKETKIHIEYSNGFDTSYVVDINNLTGDVRMVSNHLDTERNGIVTRNKSGKLNFIKNIIFFCDYYYLKKDTGKLCAALENYIDIIK